MSANLEKMQQIVGTIFKIDAKKIFFIYTPPKVGSTTLVSSLRISLGKTSNVIHIHDDIMLNVLTGVNGISVNDIINYLAQQGKEVYVIDVYRTPIERKISEFFEKISSLHFNNSEENIRNYNIERLINRFNKLFPYLACGDHYFEKYNINEPIEFDFKKKYTIQEINNIKFIKLRLCDSGEWDRIFTQILNIEIVMINDYQTDNKSIGELYKRFKEYYRLPSNFFDLIKNCKYFNFYYSEEERNNYLNNWSNKLCCHFISYTNEEYIFYINLCLENQYINDIQQNHYIDNGCYCNSCNKKRYEYFMRVKKGETISEKIIHTDVVNNVIEKRVQKIQTLAKNINNYIIEKNRSKKFKPKQFSINNITK
jgi:hypothetical protein